MPEVNAAKDVQVLRAEGVRLVAGSLTDLAGVTRAKYVPTDRLGAFAHAGMGVSPSWSVFCVDSTIAFTPALGVVGDRRLRIDPGDLRLIGDGIAWAPAILTDQEGRPVTICVRSLLRACEAGLAARGLSALIGAELEFTLLAPDGGHATTDPWSPYGIRPSLERATFLTDLTTAAERAGLPVEQVHTEYGHDQIELSVAPSAPVAAADAVILARIVVGQTAARHGLKTSFSPVPFAGEAGNGAHLHLSLADAHGPLFSGGTGPHGMRSTGMSAIAGVLDTLPDLVGVYAGSVLSAARLKPGNWAGAANCWGLENREAAVRFIADTPGNPHGANVELKIIDPSANPYLATLALLGSALRGIDNDLRLPAEVPDNPAGIVEPLQADQATVLERLENSSAAAELLGPDVIDGLLAVRRHELHTYGTQPAADTCTALRLAWSC